MFEKIKEGSKVMFLVGVVFYSLGFMTLSSFYARFGMVNFDIVNARFLIAGFISTISIVIALYITWYIYKIAPINKIFDSKDWWKRIMGFFGMYSIIQISSIGLTSLFNSFKYAPPSKIDSFVFKGLLEKYDYIGFLIQNLNLDDRLSYDFFFKTNLYVLAYLCLVSLLFILIIIITNSIPKKEKIKNPIVEENIEPNENESGNRWLYMLRCLIEVMIISFFISLSVWSFLKLRTSYIDFSSITNEPVLTGNLLFAWMYNLVIFLYFFLNLSFKDGINLSLFKNPNNFDTYDNLLRQIVVPVITSIVFFGWTVFPRIPVAIGGGQPKEIKINTNIDIGVKDDSKVFLLGESSQSVFIVIKDDNKGRALQLNKQNIQYIQTKEDSN